MGLETLEAVQARWTALHPLLPSAEERVAAFLEAPFVATSNVVEDKQALTLAETEVFFESGLTSAGRKVEDFIALERHREALAEARAKARAGAPLTVDLIRAIHHALTHGLKDRDHGPGEWKQKANRPTVRRGRTFRYATPEQVPALMRDLVAGYEGLAGRVHPLEAVTWFSYHFHLIHPFNDSNGRVQRLVASFLLLKAGLRELMIEPRDRGAYLDALAACDATVTQDRLVPLYAGIQTRSLAEFFAEALARTLSDALALLEGTEARTTADVARNAARDQKAMVVRLRAGNPDLAWRQDATNELKALQARVVASLKAACVEGGIYAIASHGDELVSDHGVDPLLRAQVPPGGAGLVGQTGLAFRPKSGVALKLPAPRSFRVAVVATKQGLQIVSAWENEARATVRHGPGTASQWSQASVERHLAERVERARRAYDEEIVELNRSSDIRTALRAVTERRPKPPLRSLTEEKLGARAADLGGAEIADPAAVRPDAAGEKKPGSKRLPRVNAAREERRVRRSERSDRLEKAASSPSGAAPEGEKEKPLDGIRPVEPPLSL